jgi:hypothetical protein
MYSPLLLFLMTMPKYYKIKLSTTHSINNINNAIGNFLKNYSLLIKRKCFIHKMMRNPINESPDMNNLPLIEAI